MVAFFFAINRSTAINSIRKCFLICVSPPIGQALTTDLRQRSGSAFFVAGLAMRKAEVKFRAVFLKVLLGNMVIRPDKAALEQAEEGFHRIAMGHSALNRAAFLRVLFARVIHSFMAKKLAADFAAILACVIRHKVGIGRNVGIKDRLERLGRDVRNVEGTHRTVTLDQRENLVLVGSATNATARNALDRSGVAVEGLIGLNDLAAPTNRAAAGFDLEGFADTVRHEPGRFVGHAKHAVQLVARHALFAGADKVRGQNPFVKGNLGTLENRPYGHAKLLAAVPTEQEARTGTLTLNLCHKAAIALYAATVGAYRAIGPALGLKVLSGGLFVVEAFGGEVHGVSPMDSFSPLDMRLSSI